jgi:hypothetical protein
MLKTIRNVLIALLVLTTIGVIAIYFYNHDRTYYNGEDEIGNTAGNIYNGGLFCEQDGNIYYSNPSADGALYVMNSDLTKFKKLRDDKAVYINADENYLYYVRANNTRENDKGGFLMFYNTGVFRCGQNGKNLMAYTGNPGAYLTLKGNNIYFQRYDVEIGLFLYKYQIDGDLERCLVQDAVIPAAVFDNKLYYAGYSKDHNINAMDLSSFTTHPVIEGSFMYPVFLGNYIYYMDPSEKYRIYRMNQDGTDPTKIVKYRTSTYNITNSGKYLYYQVDDSKHNGIHRLNLETMEDETLKTGNYKDINVTDAYVFFRDFDETNTYVMYADGTSDISIFTGMEEDTGSTN